MALPAPVERPRGFTCIFLLIIWNICYYHYTLISLELVLDRTHSPIPSSDRERIREMRISDQRGEPLNSPGEPRVREIPSDSEKF